MVSSMLLGRTFRVDIGRDSAPDRQTEDPLWDSGSVESERTPKLAEPYG